MLPDSSFLFHIKGGPHISVFYTLKTILLISPEDVSFKKKKKKKLSQTFSPTTQTRYSQVRMRRVVSKVSMKTRVQDILREKSKELY